MYRKGEIGQVARALRVLDGLRGFKHGRWVSELAAEVSASERTVRRDITELQDAGFDIELSKRENRTIARLTSERNYTSVSITKRERFTLLAVRSVFDVLRGTPLHDDVVSVLAKLEQRLNTSKRSEVAALRDRFAYVPDGGTKAYDDKQDIIDAIQTGILSRKLVRYTYKDSRGRTKRGLLAPFALLLYRHGLYAVGSSGREPTIDTTDWRSTLAVFAVERFTAADHIRASTFAVPSDFKIDDVLHGAFGVHVGDPAAAKRVEVEFGPDKAALVEGRLWHQTQRLERMPAGGVRLSFTVVDLRPVVSWILEWGPHARVLAPPELVVDVRNELSEALRHYR
jgi:predicted DNA-binding transcriptional regulator YafY